MADDEELNEEEQQKKKEPPKPVDWKIFLNDMNSWFSSFFIENMRTDNKPDALNRYHFMGTRQNSPRLLPSLFTAEEIKINYDYNYKCPVFDNDIIVYNLDRADFNEIDYIIKGLKALKYEKEKVLVIVSSIMTWARTPPKIKKEEGEEAPEEENAEGEGEGEKKEEENAEGEEKEPISEEEEYVLEEGEAEPEEEKEKEPEEDKKEGEGEEGEAEGGEGQPAPEEEKKEEPPKHILYFKERDFIKRIPSRKFYHNKMVETVALANTNPNLKAYIVCSGLIYGCGEDLFYDYFKMAWLQKPPKLPIIGKGRNTVPTIHIKDLISLIRKVIETRPKNKYIFAIDHTKNRMLKNIISSISKGVGTGEVENIKDEKEIESVPHNEELSIDIKAKPTKLFLDEKRDDEEEEEFEKRCFKWHCEFGIPENQEKLRKEFNEYRGMKNVKIFISGPPGSGKSYIAKKLSEFYNIPHYTIKDIVEWGKTLKDELGEEIRAKMEEINTAVAEAKENYKKRQHRKATDLPLDVSQLIKFPDELVIKILRKRLAMNICMNSKIY
ncbi:MAG: hypothetical protein MJ252_23055 [archaeon]|nr:hypothetical protein [archaeon]